MLIQPDELSVRQMYAYMVGMITPRPIAWVSTVGPSGVTNLAPFSFFNGVSAKPAALCFSAVNNRDGSLKDTIRNIEATGQFVVNVVPAALAEVMNQTSFEYPADESEIDAVGIEVVPSQIVSPPRVKASPIQIECQLIQVVKVGDGPAAGNLVVGQILVAHIDDAVLNAAGEIDPDLLDTIGRMGASDYCWTRQRFALPRPGSA